MGLMYWQNPTAVCSLSQHTNLPEFQIQCPEPHLGANIHHPKTSLFNTTDNIWHLQIQLISLPLQKKLKGRYLISAYHRYQSILVLCQGVPLSEKPDD